MWGSDSSNALNVAEPLRLRFDAETADGPSEVRCTLEDIVGSSKGSDRASVRMVDRTKRCQARLKLKSCRFG